MTGGVGRTTLKKEFPVSGDPHSSVILSQFSLRFRITSFYPFYISTLYKIDRSENRLFLEPPYCPLEGQPSQSMDECSSVSLPLDISATPVRTLWRLHSLLQPGDASWRAAGIGPLLDRRGRFALASNGNSGGELGGAADEAQCTINPQKNRTPVSLPVGIYFMCLLALKVSRAKSVAGSWVSYLNWFKLDLSRSWGNLYAYSLMS